MTAKLPSYLLLLPLLSSALTSTWLMAETPSSAKQPGWIQRSNTYTQLLLDVDKKYSPESQSAQGLSQYDTGISVPTLENERAERQDTEAVLQRLRTALTKEPSGPVAEDLTILLKATEHQFRQQDYGLQHQVPFLNPTSYVFGGVQDLLDDQTAPERRKAAVIRLSKYAGLTPGFQPIASILQSRVQSQMEKPGVIYPSRERVTVELSRNPALLTGIADLFREYKLTGWEASYAKLKTQLTAYDAWTRRNVLPKARTDFRLPPPLYALALEGYGVDIAPSDLARLAHETFSSLQTQMQGIARQIATQRHLPDPDYRAVMRELKKQQVVGEAILPLYRNRLAAIEQIIREHRIVTLPDRPAIIRLATAAETVQSPAPHMVPPPFLHNTGQRGVFVLPLNMPAEPGKAGAKYDDFTFDAAAWTLVAHEARPGHELQFDSMVEQGVSQARALYAFNSTNAEGWGLYSEMLILPYMPLEGQLVSLDYRLLRAARAFLDPELQAGKIQPADAQRILERDVVQSVAFAREEVERYTIKSPGQANSYFYGFLKLISLRKETEQALGSRFRQMRFHDYLLSLGLLSPELLRKAILDNFIPEEQKASN